CAHWSSGHVLLYSVWLCRPPSSPLFPYTTLFRSVLVRAGAIIQVAAFVLVAVSPSIGKWVLYVGGATLAIGNGLSQPGIAAYVRSEEHTSELQSLRHLVCRLRLEKKKVEQPRLHP